MESALQTMPVQGASRNFGECAEEAVVTEEPTIKQKRPLFIETDTIGASLEHLKNDCIIPVLTKDNEATLFHAVFTGAVQDVTNTFFSGKQIESSDTRVSRIIRGRIPEAIHRPASQLSEGDKTIYYEKCAFVIEVSTTYGIVRGNRLTLTVNGVRTYNHANLYSKRGTERLKVFIGSACKVCTDLRVSIDGYLSCLEVTNIRDLYQVVLETSHKYGAAKYIHLMQFLGNISVTEYQFCQLLGRTRLCQSPPQGCQKDIPKMLPTDTQVNNMTKAYTNDESFDNLGDGLSMQKLYNLLTDANKNNYIDPFLDRAYNATELVMGICPALHGDDKYQWFLSQWYYRVFKRGIHTIRVFLNYPLPVNTQKIISQALLIVISRIILLLVTCAISPAVFFLMVIWTIYKVTTVKQYVKY